MKTYLNRQYISHFLLWGISAVFMASAVIPQAKAASMNHADMEGMDDMDMRDMDMPAQKPKPQQSSTPAQHFGHSIAPNKSTKTGASAYPPITPSAQWPATPPPVPKVHYVQHIHPVMDHNTYFHALLEQFEGRYTPSNSLFRYSGQAWFGTDYNKFWVKSEGILDGHRRFSDGDHEFFYDRAISTYFDVQAGIRLDVDSGPTRAWGAVGVQGLALYFFDVSATAYFNNTGVAGKLEGSYDFLITNRLILQPQAELNFYSHADPERGVSRGFSDIDAGLRLRYEFKRQIAPYIAVTYAGHYGSTASVARNNTRMAENGPEDLRFTFGIRSWF